MPAKKAFVLMPFKAPYDFYYSTIFKPALEAANYVVSRADDLFWPGPIIADIQKSIIDADLILCEMSERNPNVFYELGLAHAIGKPAILVSQKKKISRLIYNTYECLFTIMRLLDGKINYTTILHLQLN